MDNNETKGCPRDCKRCNLPQQAYCAAQMSLSTMDTVQSLSDRFDAFVAKINGLFASQALVAPNAQEGAAVQRIDSPSRLKTKDNEL